jgi:hypothetical protein
MGHEAERQPRLGQYDGFQKPGQVRFKVAETAHMPAQRVFHQTVGPSLAPPVKGRDPETAAGEMADGFIVFFDALIASLQQNDRAARDRSRRT